MENKEETLLELTLLYPWFWVFVGIMGLVFYSAYKTDANPSSKQEGDDLITQGGTLEKELKRNEQEFLLGTPKDDAPAKIDLIPDEVGKSGG
jgi:hypothetical protein